MTRSRAAALVLVSCLAACSGGGSPHAAPSPPVPTVPSPTALAAPTRHLAPSPGRSARRSPSATRSAAPVATRPPAAYPAGAWPTYHGDGGRSGDAGSSVPALQGALRTAWSASLDGAVYGQPVLVGSSALVATEQDSVYALDVGTGRVRWRRHLGTPVPLSALPCGNIDPLGITGTPAYDPATGLVFVVAETTGGYHTLFALDGTSGVVRWRRGLDVLGSRDRSAEQERGALLVTRGRVVVPFGGLYGDCGNYLGYVTSVATSGQGGTTTYAVPAAREAGIWSSPGPVLGPNGEVYVSVGNGAATSGSWDGSDAVLALDPLTLRPLASFAPSTWPSDNAQDLDLGSTSPVLVGGQVVGVGKRGTAYLLSSGLRLLATLSGCTSFGGAAVRGPTAYLPCDGGVRQLRVGSHAMSWGWQAGGIVGSPVLAGPVMYVLSPSQGTFIELSLSTGQVLRSLGIAAGVTRFASPTVAAGGQLVLVPTLSGVVAVS